MELGKVDGKPEGNGGNSGGGAVLEGAALPDGRGAALPEG